MEIWVFVKNISTKLEWTKYNVTPVKTSKLDENVVNIVTEVASFNIGRLK